VNIRFKPDLDYVVCPPKTATGSSLGRDCSARPGYGIRIFSAIGKQLLTNLEKPGTLKK
jgi:hypothetical protein